jgi:hypothetical protein
MTKDEIAKIKKVIRMIHHEDKYFEALDILAEMVGMKTSGTMEGGKDNKQIKYTHLVNYVTGEVKKLHTSNEIA